MCIAIFKPKNIIIEKDILKTCSENNPDGIGFAYIKDNKIIINKYMDFDDFYSDYSKVEITSPMLIHFRIATHGKVSVQNCHPFRLNSRMALVHNGIISGYGDRETKSDTLDFIEKVIGNISYKMWKNPSFRELVGNAIGYSKFCILDVSGNHYIINEQKGVWVDGVWFSNTSYKPKVTYIKTSDKDDKTWDMYGNETYDSWYKRTHKSDDGQQSLFDTKHGDIDNTVDEDDYAFIYQCTECGKIFKSQEYDDVKCPKCKCEKIDEVGCYYDGTDYYYTQEQIDEMKKDDEKVGV